jgi:hypothetical protein
VWKGVIHGKNVCKQKHGKKLCVASTCSGVHGRISMTTPLDFYLKKLFLSNPPLELCQTFLKFSLGSVKGSFKILASSRLLQGSYTYWKWGGGGLKLSIFPLNLVKIVFSSEA